MADLNAQRRKRKGAETTASPPESGIAPLLAEGSGLAPIWTTARVGRAPDTEQYRVDVGDSSPGGHQFREKPISDDGRVITAPAESPHGSVT
jgi:hypothetical protein